MTMQFFASVRRNQRQWMVVVTILSIFAFLFDDVVRGTNNLTSNSTALFIAVLCAGVMAILGYPRGHTVMYGLTGFIVGGGAALIGATFAANKPLVRTNLGNFSQHDIQELQIRRNKVRNFIFAAARKVKSIPPDIGDSSELQMVGFALMQREARRMGVSISNDAVNEFIKDFTDDKLTASDFTAALRDSAVAESELFELLRGELEVKLISQLMQPAGKRYVYREPFSGRTGQANQATLTPEQLWEHFRKLHVTQRLTAVAVPITEFVRQVAEPTEAELKTFFDKYKNRNGDEYGNPGFLEPPRVRLAYLAATNVEHYEKGLSEPTDQEVVDYYNEHLHEFRVMPEFPQPKQPKANPDAPADALTPDNVPIEPVVTPEKAVTPEKTTDGPAPERAAPEKPQAEEPKPGDPPKDDGAKKDGSCGDETQAAAKESTDDPKSARPDEDQPKPAPENPPDDRPPPPSLPTSDDAPKSKPDPHGDISLPGVTMPGPAVPPSPAPPRYRELDEHLKLDIREKVLLAKANQRMSDAADQAKELMDTLDLKYNEVDAAKRGKLAEEFATQLKDYAASHNLEYHETALLTSRELQFSSGEPIGAATSGSGPRSRAVADDVFLRDATGRQPFLQLYSARRADTPNAKYAYWKIEDVPAKDGDLKNEATHQLAVDAWKFDKARGLAEKRAQQLAELMKKGEADIPSALSGQTINGAADSPAVTVRETQKFTWLREFSSFPMMGFSPPTTSMIDDIDHPGFSFMKTVFEELGNGQTGVALNDPRTVYYAVRVHDRDADSPESDGGVALQKLQLQFMGERLTSPSPPTPYDLLAVQTENGIEAMWRQNFNVRYGIRFEGRTLQGSNDQEMEE